MVYDGNELINISANPSSQTIQEGETLSFYQRLDADEMLRRFKQTNRYVFHHN